MNGHFEKAVPKSIDGHLLQLGEGYEVAIYTREGVFWVAEFRDGRSELLDASTFFRFHAGALRYSNRRHAAALESARGLTPEVLDRIERLHQQLEADDARILGASVAVVASVMRCCRGLTLMIRSRTAKIAERRINYQGRRRQPHFLG
jgi:hypothetical protein